MSVYNQYLNSSDEYKIKLDSNEIYMDIDQNILMKMKSCLTSVDINRYPDNEMKMIRELYADYAKVDADNIIVGNGSDEAIQMAVSRYGKSGSNVLTLSPDFTMYDFYVARYGGNLNKYKLDKDIDFNVEEFIEAGKSAKVDLIIFSNPNNPTGRVIPAEDIIRVLDEFKDKTVVVDEAYYEFYGKSMVSYINEYKNLIVTRTLSKAWGLAALRIGFLITNKENIEELLNYKVPYTISSYSQKLASIILKYPGKVIENTKLIIKNREELYKNLKAIQENAAMKIAFYPSNGNYIYGKTPHKEALIKGLESNGIYIRNFKDDSFRITVGSPMQNKKVIESIKKGFVY